MRLWNCRISARSFATRRPEATGKLMNLRIAQVAVDDEWLTETTFDPEAHTNRVIAALDIYKKHGILAINVSLQGANPEYKLSGVVARDRHYRMGPGKGMYTSAFRPDGSLKPDWMARTLRLAKELDKRGMILNLFHFYGYQDEVFPDTATIDKAAANATDWLIDNKLKNVVIEIANEHDGNPYDHNRCIRNEMGKLIELVRSRFKDRRAEYMLPISASTLGGRSIRVYDADALCGEPLPWSSLERLREMQVVLKAPLLAGRRTGGVTVRQNGTTRHHPGINNALRRELGSFVNLRLVRGWRGPSGDFAGMDLVIMREVTEDIDSGLERQVNDDCAEAIKRVTGTASRRIAKFSCDYAQRMGRRKITAVHKANVLHLTDGLFLESVRSVVAGYSDLEFEEQAIDAACYLAVKKPDVFDVVVLPNQYRDIFSDLTAALAGSLGLAPGASIGDHTAMFEAAHGAAPDIAGRGIANPIGLVRSGALLLDHIGQSEAAERVRSGIASLVEREISLKLDLGGTASTHEFTRAACTAAQCT